jgi:Ca2+-binding RTX toxin-like protein
MKNSTQEILRRTRGRDTIFGGSGESYYLLSNGNNWLDAGGGNEYIEGGDGKDLFGGINCVAANDLEWRKTA